MIRTTLCKLLPMALLTIMLSSCLGPRPTETVQTAEEEAAFFEQDVAQLPKSDMKRFQSWDESLQINDTPEYRIGAGDVLDLQVWQHPELSVADLLVGPDGVISLPRAGDISVADMSRVEATELISEELAKLYSDIEVTLTVRVYRNNKAFVLGDVARPGVVHFTGPGTLVEALTMAGGMATPGQDIADTDAAIIRGRDQIIWVNLHDLLLGGNTAINMTLQSNDVVYVPPQRQQLVYVMGEVLTPRAVPLSRGMTYMDAVMLAGGPTSGAELDEAYLLRWRDGKGLVKGVNLRAALEAADFSQNYLLRDKDVVYLGPTGLTRFNYFLDELTPTLRTINLGAETVRRF